MKKNLLLMMMCCPIVLAAQNGVTVSGLAISAGTATFNVSWTNSGMPELWSDTVWVFVDYNNKGVMERLPLLSGATLTATSPGGKVIEDPDNNKGVWVAGNARTNGSFSATVKLFTSIADIGGACVYGSNYPPVGKYSSSDASKIVFTGTPAYDVALLHESGTLVTTTTSSPLNIPASYTVHSFTDKTAAPGIIKCIAPATYTLLGSDVCTGANVTLTLSGSQSGWHYQLYKNNIPVGSKKEGTGSALTFSEASATVGGFSYTVQTVDASGAQCEIAVSNVHSITVNPVPGAPTMSGSSSYCTSGTITATVGSGGNGIKWDSGSTISLRTVTATDTYRAVTTSAAGCTSSSATKSVTIVQQGQSGNAATACGCASDLTECYGTCLASCGMLPWPNNPCGLSYVSNVATEDNNGLYARDAEAFCANKGMRLPNPAELDCMCSNWSTLPAGYGLYWYWSSARVGDTCYNVDFRNCRSVYGDANTVAYVKCVK
jgi:hypothetical protein